MIISYCASALSAALAQLKTLVAQNEAAGKTTVIFCEDRLTLAAERTVCAAVGGTFSTSVYTFARFLAAEKGKRADVLSSQGAAMVIRKLIEDNADRLKLFKKLYAASAAQSVYDTIALLYSSRISAEDLKGVETDNKLLKNKLNDVALLYEKYDEYLEATGRMDRNSYLRLLPPAIEESPRIRGNCVVLLGFQSFTGSTTECVRSVMKAAGDVLGLFIGGKEDFYTNEALATFSAVAEGFGGAQTVTLQSGAIEESEHIRRHIFNPECFKNAQMIETDRVHLFEGADEAEELEFIAASIKKHVLSEGERYAKISVMLPDVGKLQGTLERVFAQYRIPFYIDRRISLAEHGICGFIADYLSCAADGCTPESVSAVVSSPLFGGERQKCDIFRNYILRSACYRGGVKRAPSEAICAANGFDYAAVSEVRERFLKGLALLPAKGEGGAFCSAVKELLLYFGAEEGLKKVAEKNKDIYPVQAQFSGRAYQSAVSVLDEAAVLTEGLFLSAKEFLRILKSGFAACEISLIPPKADAVFVGDVAATANTGSDVVFAAGLTDAVPRSGADTALLTDREIAALEEACISVSPKIRQVNLRAREITALNICAFRKHLYLSYPVMSGGEECARSEIVGYVGRLFAGASGKPLRALTQRQIEASMRALPYYCSEKLPAAKQLVKLDASPAVLSAVYAALDDNGYKIFAEGAMAGEREKGSISQGRSLFVRYGSVTPTTLETYFSCPYKNFMKQGLQLAERMEGPMRANDAGNFIHRVLELVGAEVNGIPTEEALRKRAESIAAELLKTPSYAPLTDSKAGKYTAGSLVYEAVEVCAGMFEQLKNSRFTVARTEGKCDLPVTENVKLFGKIDRVDECGDMVRVIDYKTGDADPAPTKYYMGLKLQLPLYLSAAAGGKRAVGAYYFPASLGFAEKRDGVFRLQGFMDGSADVVQCSDTTLQPGAKSAYVDARLGGKNSDSTMPAELFADFLGYSRLVSEQGAREMIAGNVSPSPAQEACKYCKLGGACGFFAGADGEERTVKTVKCADIAHIVRRQRGEEE